MSSEPELTLGAKSRRSIERGSAYLFAITPISKLRYHKNDGKEEREVTRNTIPRVKLKTSSGSASKTLCIAAMALRRLQRQYLHFCTIKASKLST